MRNALRFETPWTDRRVAPPSASSPGLLRAVLLAGSVGVGLLAAALAGPAVLAGGEPQLVVLLRGMALLKAGMALAAAALVCWRFGWRISLPAAAGYIAGVWCFVAAAVLIWCLSALATAAVIFHAGLFGLLLLALNDGRGTRKPGHHSPLSETADERP